jgi:hypothetical protein
MDGKPEGVSKEGAVKEGEVEERFEATLVMEPRWPLGSSLGGGAKSSAVTPLPIC